MPEERPTKLVVDCSQPLMLPVLDENGDSMADDEGRIVFKPNPERAKYVPLTDKEMEQRAKDQAEAEAREAAEKAAQEEKEQAIERIKANPEFADLVKALNL